MTREALHALTDADLLQVIAWGQEEQKDRAEKRKQETIAKIKELARSIEVGVTLAGTRGRPARNPSAKAAQKYSRPQLKKPS